jgi:hypothetical protein
MTDRDLEVRLRRAAPAVPPPPERVLEALVAATAEPPTADEREPQRRRARRALAAVALAALAIAIATPAFGLHRRVVSWFEAEPAPERVQLSFARLDVGAPPGMETGVIAASARKVMTARVGGQTRVLWVAPTKSGGFCLQWTNLSGGCTTDRVPPRRLRGGPDLHTFELGVGYQQTGRGITTVLSGRLLDSDTERLELRFADGESVEIPVVWVSPPIDAGFYIYEVPEEHRRVGRQVSALVALDGDDEVLARQTFPLPPASDVEHSVRLPDGEVVALPRKAIVPLARKVIDRRAWNGDRLWLWVVPTRDGGQCWVSNRAGGCPPPDYELDVPMAAGIGGGGLVLFQGQVRADVSLVELHYESGEVERLRPVEGFVLHDISSEHYPRGRRLVLVVARASDGTVLDRQRYRPDTTGVYPCEEPVDIGLGVKACP